MCWDFERFACLTFKPCQEAGEWSRFKLPERAEDHSQYFRFQALTAVLWLLGVHQYEQNSARTYAVVHPSMVRRLLHDHVTLLEMHAGIVKNHVDFSGEYYRVVEATCAMHQRVLNWNAFGRRVRDPLLDHFGRKLCFTGGIERCKFYHAELGPVVGRSRAESTSVRLGG